MVSENVAYVVSLWPTALVLRNGCVAPATSAHSPELAAFVATVRLFANETGGAYHNVGGEVVCQGRGGR